MGIASRLVNTALRPFDATLEIAGRAALLLPVNWRRDPLPLLLHALRLFQYFRGWCHYALRSKARLSEMRDRHKGQRCFIICNGPSLNRLNLNLLKDEITFGVNSIYLKFPELSFRPTYYTVEDHLVCEDRKREINALAGCGMTRFLPSKCAYCFKDANDVIWMNCPETNGEHTVPSFSKAPELFLFHGSTITFVCIQLAYHFGCDPVYLIGCDNDYAKPDSVKVAEHGRWTSTEDDPNHFDPRYFGKGYRWHDPRTDLMTRSYRIARWVFEESGRNIYNATDGGKLEVFPRVDYTSLFDQPRPTSHPQKSPMEGTS